MTSIGTSHGRHRLAGPDRRPNLLPRSVTMVGVTVGAVLALGIPDSPSVPAPRPHPDAPALSALQPVIPAPRDSRPARLPGEVTGRDLAGAHLDASASLGALAAVAATQPPGGVDPASLFSA